MPVLCHSTVGECVALIDMPKDLLVLSEFRYLPNRSKATLQMALLLLVSSTPHNPLNVPLTCALWPTTLHPLVQYAESMAHH
jgi:hypothetical protein